MMITMMVMVMRASTRRRWNFSVKLLECHEGGAGGPLVASTYLHAVWMSGSR